MKVQRNAILVFHFVTVFVTIVVSQEIRIQRSELPPVVEKTVQVESRGATIKGFSREKENGQTLYEAELLFDGRRKDILITSNGAVVEVEESVSMDSLPAAVKLAFTAKAGKGTILSVESITKHNKLVAYEAEIMLNGKRTEIKVGPDGKSLVREE